MALCDINCKKPSNTQTNDSTLKVTFSECNGTVFGVNCLRPCHCDETEPNNLCDKISGICPYGCAAEYTPDDHGICIPKGTHLENYPLHL